MAAAGPIVPTLIYNGAIQATQSMINAQQTLCRINATTVLIAWVTESNEGSGDSRMVFSILTHTVAGAVTSVTAPVPVLPGAYFPGTSTDSGEYPGTFHVRDGVPELWWGARQSAAQKICVWRSRFDVTQKQFFDHQRLGWPTGSTPPPLLYAPLATIRLLTVGADAGRLLVVTYSRQVGGGTPTIRLILCDPDHIDDPASVEVRPGPVDHAGSSSFGSIEPSAVLSTDESVWTVYCTNKGSASQPRFAQSAADHGHTWPVVATDAAGSTNFLPAPVAAPSNVVFFLDLRDGRVAFIHNNHSQMRDNVTISIFDSPALGTLLQRRLVARPSVKGYAVRDQAPFAPQASYDSTTGLFDLAWANQVGYVTTTPGNGRFANIMYSRVSMTAAANTVVNDHGFNDIGIAPIWLANAPVSLCGAAGGPSKMIAVGNGGWLIHTEDGGVNWTTVQSSLQQDQESVVYSDNANGRAAIVGQFFQDVVGCTTDNGNFVINVTRDRSGIGAVAAVTPGGYVAVCAGSGPGTSGRLYRTVNDGADGWFQISSPVSVPLFSAATSTSYLWGAGGPNTVIRAPIGTPSTWSVFTSPFSGSDGDVQVFCFGSDIIMTRDDPADTNTTQLVHSDNEGASWGTISTLPCPGAFCERVKQVAIDYRGCITVVTDADSIFTCSDGTYNNWRLIMTGVSESWGGCVSPDERTFLFGRTSRVMTNARGGR